MERCDLLIYQDLSLMFEFPLLPLFILVPFKFTSKTYVQSELYSICRVVWHLSLRRRDALHKGCRGLDSGVKGLWPQTFYFAA